jgi:hypothetical protein
VLDLGAGDGPNALVLALPRTRGCAEVGPSGPKTPWGSETRFVAESNLLMALDDRWQLLRLLIHDRDAKFGGGCDHLCESKGITLIRTPVQAPNANAPAERWVGSVRRECLDRLLILSRRQAEHRPL